jgi:uncharacterized protein (TIGR02466 family)
MIVHNLFPTPVAYFNYDKGFTEDEVKYLTTQEMRANMGNITSVDNFILKQECLSNLKEFCDASVNEYFQAMYQPKYDVKPYITQSWVNYTEPGQFHHKHEHPNSFISGVLYIEADEKFDKIYFYRDKYKQIKVTEKEFNIYNSTSWWLSVKTCNLMLFPSDLTHMVATVEDSENRTRRTSLAFNTFLKGNLGDELELTALNLGD